jgi:hypothetical protein
VLEERPLQLGPVRGHYRLPFRLLGRQKARQCGVIPLHLGVDLFCCYDGFCYWQDFVQNW